MSTFIDHHIVARKVQFDFSQTPRHWVPNDVLTTHVLNSMHVLYLLLSTGFVVLQTKRCPMLKIKPESRYPWFYCPRSGPRQCT